MSKPILAGLMLLAVALAGCEDDAPDPVVVDDDPLSPLYWPFLDVFLDEGDDYVLFTQWPAEGDAPLVPFGFEWVSKSERSGFYGGTAEAGDVLGNLTLHAAGDGPRFGLEGYNATRADIYVFEDDDTMIAHTETISDLEAARAPWPAVAFRIPDEVYYLGDGEAPEGTEPLPPYLSPYKATIRDLAMGLGVGGAAAAFVPQEEAGIAGDFYGDLYVTAQITELVHAP